MRLCAASRPVSILPDSSSVSPGFHVATSAGGERVEIDAPRGRRGVHCTRGQRERSGGSSFAAPEPSSVKCAWRVAAQFGIMPTGFDAACVG